MLPFLTARDPLGGSSGSIHPLGALQTYHAFADLLLPADETLKADAGGVTAVRARERRQTGLFVEMAGQLGPPESLPAISPVLTSVPGEASVQYATARVWARRLPNVEPLLPRFVSDSGFQCGIRASGTDESGPQEWSSL